MWLNKRFTIFDHYQKNPARYSILNKHLSTEWHIIKSIKNYILKTNENYWILVMKFNKNSKHINVKINITNIFIKHFLLKIPNFLVVINIARRLNKILKKNYLTMEQTTNCIRNTIMFKSWKKIIKYWICLDKILTIKVCLPHVICYRIKLN